MGKSPFDSYKAVGVDVLEIFVCGIRVTLALIVSLAGLGSRVAALTPTLFSPRGSPGGGRARGGWTGWLPWKALVYSQP